MVRYIGLDVDKRFIEVCILDGSGKPAFRGKASCVREELIRFAKAKLKRTDQVALESTTNTWPVVEILRPFVARIVVGNPLKTKAIAEAKVKTDKVDAEVLAQLLRCNYLPEVWQPDDRTRQLRSWGPHRADDASCSPEKSGARSARAAADPLATSAVVVQERVGMAAGGRTTGSRANRAG
jgi:transposase